MWTDLQQQAEELTGNDVAQKVLANLRPKAKECNGDGEVQSEVRTHLQLHAKEAELGGSATLCRQRGPLESDLLQAKELEGDGEVQYEVLTCSQSQAKDFKGDGVVQHEVPTILQSEAKEVDTVEGEIEASGSARSYGQHEPWQVSPFD